MSTLRRACSIRRTSRQESRRRGLLPVVSGWAIRTILVFKGRFFLASRWIPRRPSTCSDTCGRSADRRGRNTHWTLSGLKCEPTSRAPWVREPISSQSRTHRARSWVSGCAHRTNLAGSRRYGDIRAPRDGQRAHWRNVPGHGRSTMLRHLLMRSLPSARNVAAAVRQRPTDYSAISRQSHKDPQQ